MKLHFCILLLFLNNFSYCQNWVSDYLEVNRQDLRVNSRIETGDVKIIGFGALHGSSKTEETETILLKDLITNEKLSYYFPETDFSTANYFQEYIETGDEELLRELIYEYGARVPQEGSVEVFDKWKILRRLFQANNVHVVGVDEIASYKFSVKELVKLCVEISDNQYLDSLKHLLENDDTIWIAYYNTAAKMKLRQFIADFENNKSKYLQYISDTASFNHIIQNIKLTYEKRGREQTMYNNYLKLSRKLQLEGSLQFFRLGVFHIMKSRINSNPSFFAKLIENKNYLQSEVLTFQGFLTKSKVLWETKFDGQGKYSGYSTKAGYGISDYWLEHYKGIKKLKQHKLSDITLFNLSKRNTPYDAVDAFELVEIRKLLGKSFWSPEKGKSTIDYIDFAILITHSKANRPIEARNNDMRH